MLWIPKWLQQTAESQDHTTGPRNGNRQMAAGPKNSQIQAGMAQFPKWLLWAMKGNQSQRESNIVGCWLHLSSFSMVAINSSEPSATYFILIGLPGLEEAQFWLAFPLCSLYLIAVLGNLTIIYIVRTEHSLHEPMYVFLCMLSGLDILISTSSMPKMMAIFWFNSTTIQFDACLVQMFAIHSLSGRESMVLLVMAFDLCVAICHPLRHATVLTLPRVAKIGKAAVVRSAALVAPLPVFIKRSLFCHSNILSHFYCLHQDVMKLACTDIHVNVIYGLIVIISAIGLDSLLISFSYLLILKIVLGLTREAQAKAFGTCVSRVCTVFIFYVPFIGLSMMHHFSKRRDSLLPVIMANIYLLILLCLTPLSME
ncbi:Olfactory receptor 51E1 [Microtus ochrogaster]|uniref:Olfactory receptor 51E1 n=1 Tax=Microtus ochrogaster TaxID=79684 RepID=A0A8J6GQC3_MICOH|nr:Olfactory receptor 51E1 [Microtus ochrogaster]